MYYFNSYLFSKLPKLLNMLQKEVSEAVYGNDFIYARRIGNQDSIKVNEIIDICNRFHISTRHFFLTQPAPMELEPRSSYIISDDYFETVRFYPEHIKWIYGKNGMAKGLTRDKLVESLHISPATLLRWANPSLGGEVPVKAMLDMCNLYNLDLYAFIEDKNVQADQPCEEKEPDPEPMVLTTRTWQELTELRKMLVESQRKINLLTEENERLKMQGSQYASALSEDGTYDYDKSHPRGWTANWELLKNLTYVTGASRRELMRIAQIGTYSGSLNDGNLNIPSLVRICNAFQISSRHFFMRNTGEKIALRAFSQYRSDNWKKVSFHPEYLNDLFGRESLTGLSRKEVAAMAGVSENTIRSWKMEYSTMRVKDLVNICNALSLSPWCFISDGNRPDLQYGVTHTEFLLEENLLLRQQIIRLHEQIFRMKERYGISADK